jgi:hypothetical protein
MRRITRSIVLAALALGVLAAPSQAHFTTSALDAMKQKTKDVCIAHPAGLGNYQCSPSEAFNYTFAQRGMSFNSMSTASDGHHYARAVYHVHSNVTGDDETWDVLLHFFHGGPVNWTDKRKLVD